MTHPVERWAAAFAQGEYYRSAHYNIECDSSPAAYFHGNKIAWRDELGVTWIAHRGWGRSPTTRARLQALLTAMRDDRVIHYRKGVTYFNGQVFDAPVALVGRLGAMALEHERAQRMRLAA